MKSVIFSVALLWASALLWSTAYAEAQDNSTVTETGKKRMFSFLQVMKFPNDVCNGTSKNGTCYSSDECAFKGGQASGTCANGFGVCCIFNLLCGQSSSENNTYIELAATTTPSPSVCTYTLCETAPNICRIRLDFITFVLNGPQTLLTGTNAAATVEAGRAIGDCTSDKFVVKAPLNRGSPVICGTNTGQHMYIDTAAGSCATASFVFGDAAVSRSYTIKVTQYNCQDEMGGPPDCLQYFTGNAGTFQSFNYIGTATAVGAASTHLSNQNYNICFRRNVNNCAVCFFPQIAIATNSFGLSLSPAMAAQSAVETACSDDYLIIPNGQAVATAKSTAGAATGVVTNGNERFCGRFLNPAVIGGATAPETVCTNQRPFRLTFVTNDNEVLTTIAGSAGDASLTESSSAQTGMIGYSLNFNQLQC